MGHASARRDSTSQPGPSGLNFDPQYLVTRRSSRSSGSRSSSSSRKRSTQPKKKNPMVKNLSITSFDPNRPKQFNTKDATFIISGLIEIDPDSSEEDIRCVIGATISNADVESLDTSKCSPADFEFVKRSGHVFRVPDCAPGFQFNADTLTGQGDLYIRLMKDVPKQASANSPVQLSDDSDPIVTASRSPRFSINGDTAVASAAHPDKVSSGSTDSECVLYVPDHESPMGSPLTASAHFC